MLSTDGRAIKYPRPAVTRDLHNASINNNRKSITNENQVDNATPPHFCDCCAQGCTNCLAFYSRRQSALQEWGPKTFPILSAPLVPEDKAQTLGPTPSARLKDRTLCIMKRDLLLSVRKFNFRTTFGVSHLQTPAVYLAVRIM